MRGKKKTIRKEIFKDFDIINFIQTPFENPFYSVRFLLMKSTKKVTTTKFFFTYPILAKYNFLQKLKIKFLIDHTFVFSKRLEVLAKLITNNVTFQYPPISQVYISKLAPPKGIKEKILFAGRLSRDKGLDVVLDVYKKLSKDKFYLGIIGYFSTDADKKYYEEKLKRVDLDFLQIISPVTKLVAQNRLPLNEYNILLLPYQDLAPTLDTPLLILEGLSSQCKVITSDIGSLSSIKGNIFLVKEYTDSSKFLEMVNNVSEIKIKDEIIDCFSNEIFGNKYLKSLNII